MAYSKPSGGKVLKFLSHLFCESLGWLKLLLGLMLALPSLVSAQQRFPASAATPGFGSILGNLQTGPDQFTYKYPNGVVGRTDWIQRITDKLEVARTESGAIENLDLIEQQYGTVEAYKAAKAAQLFGHSQGNFGPATAEIIEFAASPESPPWTLNLSKKTSAGEQGVFLDLDDNPSLMTSLESAIHETGHWYSSTVQMPTGRADFKNLKTTLIPWQYNYLLLYAEFLEVLREYEGNAEVALAIVRSGTHYGVAFELFYTAFPIARRLNAAQLFELLRILSRDYPTLRNDQLPYLRVVDEIFAVEKTNPYGWTDSLNRAINGDFVDWSQVQKSMSLVPPDATPAAIQSIIASEGKIYPRDFAPWAYNVIHGTDPRFTILDLASSFDLELGAKCSGTFQHMFDTIESSPNATLKGQVLNAFENAMSRNIAKTAEPFHISVLGNQAAGLGMENILVSYSRIAGARGVQFLKDLSRQGYNDLFASDCPHLLPRIDPVYEVSGSQLRDTLKRAIETGPGIRVTGPAGTPLPGQTTVRVSLNAQQLSAVLDRNFRALSNLKLATLAPGADGNIILEMNVDSAQVTPRNNYSEVVAEALTRGSVRAVTYNVHPTSPSEVWDYRFAEKNFRISVNRTSPGGRIIRDIYDLLVDRVNDADRFNSVLYPGQESAPRIAQTIEANGGQVPPSEAGAETYVKNLVTGEATYYPSTERMPPVGPNEVAIVRPSSPRSWAGQIVDTAAAQGTNPALVAEYSAENPLAAQKYVQGAVNKELRLSASVPAGDFSYFYDRGNLVAIPKNNTSAAALAFQTTWENYTQPENLMRSAGGILAGTGLFMAASANNQAGANMLQDLRNGDFGRFDQEYQRAWAAQVAPKALLHNAGMIGLFEAGSQATSFASILGGGWGTAGAIGGGALQFAGIAGAAVAAGEMFVNYADYARYDASLSEMAQQSSIKPQDLDFVYSDNSVWRFVQKSVDYFARNLGKDVEVWLAPFRFGDLEDRVLPYDHTSSLALQAAFDPTGSKMMAAIQNGLCAQNSDLNPQSLWNPDGSLTLVSATANPFTGSDFAKMTNPSRFSIDAMIASQKQTYVEPYEPSEDQTPLQIPPALQNYLASGSVSALLSQIHSMPSSSSLTPALSSDSSGRLSAALDPATTASDIAGAPLPEATEKIDQLIAADLQNPNSGLPSTTTSDFGSVAVEDNSNAESSAPFALPDTTADAVLEQISNLSEANPDSNAVDPTEFFATPVITQQPATLSIVSSNSDTSLPALSVTATSDGGTSRFQWMKNSVNISGQTSSSLSLTSANPPTSIAGSYTVKVSNNVGDITSSIAQVFLTPAQPTHGGYQFTCSIASGLPSCTCTCSGSDCYCPSYKQIPTWPAGQANTFVDVSSGGYHACALTMNSASGPRRSGTYYCWGDNHYGQISGTECSASCIKDPQAGTTVDGIAAGGFHTCSVYNGVVRCWGLMTYPLDPTHPPTNDGQLDLNGLTDIAKVDAGSRFSCALTHSGRVICAGRINQNNVAAVNCPWALTGSDCKAARRSDIGVSNAINIRLGAYGLCVDLKTGGQSCFGVNGATRY